MARESEKEMNLLSKFYVDNMKKRGNCRDCGNPWWFDIFNCWVCTMCRKTHGKDSGEQRPREDDNGNVVTDGI